MFLSTHLNYIPIAHLLPKTIQDNSKSFSPHLKPVFHRSGYVSNCKSFLKDNLFRLPDYFTFKQIAFQKCV